MADAELADGALRGDGGLQRERSEAMTHAGEVGSGGTQFFQSAGPLERAAFFVDFEHAGEAGDAARGKGLDGTGGDAVDAGGQRAVAC